MTRPAEDGSRAIRVSGETWARLQRVATPFRGSELGTPDRVIAHLLDEYESTHEPPALALADHPDADRPPGTSGSWGEA